MRLTTQILLALAALLLLAKEARADGVCTAGPVATVENTSCTIGDKLFIFGTASFVQPSNNGLTTTPQFTFTPDASNPNDPGFTVTGALSLISPMVPTTADFNWQVQIETLSGAPAIQGLSATVSGSTTPGFLGIGIGASFTACDASNTTNCVNLEPGTAPPFCSGPTCSAQGSFSPSIAMTNEAFISYLAQSIGAGGAATALDASYYVNEAPVPEPDSLVLLGAGLVFAFGLARIKSLR